MGSTKRRGSRMSDYSKGIAGPTLFVQLAQPLVTEAIDTLPASVCPPFVIADYGCADGSQNLNFFANTIKHVKDKLGDDWPILMCHEDQAGNDYNSLFNWLEGPKSYIAQHKNVFAVASATGFYSQCLPSNFVNIGFSSLAIHWMSEVPVEMKNAISYREDAATDEERELFRRQGEIDWERFLLLRAKELKDGGHLVLLSVAYHDRLMTFIPVMTDLWRSFVVDDVITEEEFQATNLALHVRTPQEFKAPFENLDSPVSKAGLRLAHITDVNLMRPLLVGMDEDNLSDEDLRSIAEKASASISSWGYTTFLDALSKRRPPAERKAIADMFFNRLVDCLYEQLGSRCYDVPIIVVHIQKV